MALLFSDDFERANSTTIGNGWEEISVADAFAIDDGELVVSYPFSSQGDSWQRGHLLRPTGTSSPSNGVIRSYFRGVQAANFGLICRWNATSGQLGDFYMAGYHDSPSKLSIFRVTNTGATLLASTSSFTFPANSLIKVEFSFQGSSLSCRWTNIDTNSVIATVSASNSALSSGRVGFTGWEDFSRSKRWGGFEVFDDSTFPSGDASISFYPKAPPFVSCTLTRLTPSSYASTVSTGVTAASADTQTFGGLTATRISQSSTVNNTAYGGVANIASTNFVTSKLTMILAALSANVSSRARPPQDNGLQVALKNSSTGAYRKFDVYMSVIPVGANYQRYVVNPAATAIETSGTLDQSAVNQIEYIYVQNSNTGFVEQFFTFPVVITTPIIAGGVASNKSTLATLLSYLATNEAHAVIRQSTAQYVSMVPIQIGDGSTNLYFDEPGLTLDFYPQKTSTDKANSLPNGHLTLDFNLAANSNFCNLKNGRVGGTPVWGLSFTIASGAVFDFSNCVWVGVGTGATTLHNNYVQVGGQFIGRSEIDAKNATLTNISISESADTSSAILLQPGTTLVNCSSSNNVAGCRIAAAGVYTSSDLQVTNNSVCDVRISSAVTTGTINISNITFPASGSTTPVNIRYEGTGTITVVVNRTGLTTTTPNGGTINLQAPTPTVLVRVSGAPTGSSIALFRRSSSKVADTAQFTLASGNNSGNSTLVISSSIPADTPTSGFIRVLRNDGATEDRLAYSSRTGSTFTLTGTLPTTYASGNGCYVGYLDVLNSSTGTESNSLTFVANRDCVVVVRKGSGTGKIQEIRQDVTLSDTGAQIQVSGVSDSINLS